MPQEFRVLQCAHCSLYQVDIVKKANKWECKICRQKQFLGKEFFRDFNASACRTKVQQLNLERGQKQEAQDELRLLKAQEEPTCSGKPERTQERKSKWADYVDEPNGKPTPCLLNPGENKNAAQEPDFSRPKKRAAQEQIMPAKKPFSKWNSYL